MNPRDETSAAVAAAKAGTQQWRTAVAAQRAATAHHSDFYELGRELVEVIRTLEYAAAALIGQIVNYGTSHELRDDEGREPVERLADAVRALARAATLLGDAEYEASCFWSAISHIRLEDPS